MRELMMTQNLEMFAGGNLSKFFKITWSSFIRINYAYSKPLYKLLAHDFCNLITAFLMITATYTYQSFDKVCVNIALRYDEIRTPVHCQRYVSRL